MTTGDDPREPGPDGNAGDGDDHAALVARVRDELDAARRRVRDAWAQYQQRVGDEHMHEAVAVPPLLTALLALVS